VASWLRLGRRVLAIDPHGAIGAGFREGRAPVREPGLVETISDGLRSGSVRFSSDPAELARCSLVFIAHDTTVREDDSTDLSEVWQSLEMVATNAAPDVTVVVSSQLPVGTARAMRERLRARKDRAELVYVPENLRLGEAIDRYLRPGYVVIGSATPRAADAADRLFAPIEAQRVHMSLESAEMTKHAINSFLATSISLANHWSDLSASVGADYGSVQGALHADPRIGERAYVSAGLGFSGGTLGRDLAVLAGLSREQLDGGAPLFEAVLNYNARRAARLVTELVRFFDGRPARVAVLGLTYKPGTSTLRRSRPVEIARALVSAGISVRAHDPGADRSEVVAAGLDLADDVYSAANSADAALLLTGWPEYRDLDLGRLGRSMRQRRLLDPAAVLRARAEELKKERFAVGWSMAVPKEWRQ